MNIGIALKRIRSALAMSQGELSERTGMSVSMISALEMGTRNPSEETVERLLIVLSLRREQLEIISASDPSKFEEQYRDLVEFSQHRVLRLICEQHEARKWLLAHA